MVSRRRGIVKVTAVSGSDPEKCPEHPDILMLFGVPSNSSGIVGLKIAIAFMSPYAQIFQTISCRSCVVVLYLFLRRCLGETAEPIF